MLYYYVYQVVIEYHFIINKYTINKYNCSKLHTNCVLVVAI